MHKKYRVLTWSCSSTYWISYREFQLKANLDRYLETLPGQVFYRILTEIETVLDYD